MLIVALAVLAGQRLSAAAQGMPRSSISSDSLPGWSPTLADREQAVALAKAYLGALDQGRYAAAYAMQAPSLNALGPMSAFQSQESTFKAKAGALLSRHMTAVTWTNHAGTSDNPGIFASIDFVERYANVDRACSYLVLFKSTGSASLKVLRKQMGSMDNATARSIAARGSSADVDAAWAAVARQYPNCPT